MKMNQRGTLRINRTLWFLKMIHAWRKQTQPLLKTSTNSKLPFSGTLLALLSTALACFFPHIFYQMTSLTILDSSLLTCWVIVLFHWVKWRTSQVNKCRNAAVLHSLIFLLTFVINLLSPGYPNLKASRESSHVSSRKCRTQGRVLLLSLYWLTGLSQTLASLSRKPTSLVSTQGAQGTSTKLSQTMSLS